MDGRRRALLALRVIEVSYRAALRGAPREGSSGQEWLGIARQRADELIDELESHLLKRGRPDPEVALRIRIVRRGIREADLHARGVVGGGERPEDRVG